MQKEGFLVLGIIIGIVVGSIIGFSFRPSQVNPIQTSCPNVNVIPISDAEKKAIDYINNNLLGGEAKARALSASPYGEHLYKVEVELYQGSQSFGKVDVYITKDGETLILRALNMSEKIEEPRVNVSVDDDPWKGNKEAEVVIVEFSDYTCPYCKKFETEILPEILQRYNGKVMVVFRDFPVHGNISITAAIAADCANEQGKFWEYHELLYEKQEEWIFNLTMLSVYAHQLGLNLSKFEACMDSRKYEEEVLKDREDGIKYGVSGTPTIFINGRKIVGVHPVEKFCQVIDEELSD